MAPSRRNKPSSLFSTSRYDRDAPTYSTVPTADDIPGGGSSTNSSHLSLPTDTEPRYTSRNPEDYSGDEDDDDLMTTPHDLDVLKEEEEREKLLSRSGIFGSIGRGDGVVIGRRLMGKKKKRRRKGIRGLVDRDDSEERVGGFSDESDVESEDEELEDIRRGRFDEKMAEKKVRLIYPFHYRRGS